MERLGIEARHDGSKAPMASFWDRIEHRFTQRRISEYVDDELSHRQRRRIERHADLCPECGPLRRALLRLTAALRDLRSPPDSSIAPNVIRRLRDIDGDGARSGGPA